MSKPRLSTGRIPFQLGISADRVGVFFTASIRGPHAHGRAEGPENSGTAYSPARYGSAEGEIKGQA